MIGRVCWPHPLHDWFEAEGEGHWPYGLDCVENENAGAIRGLLGSKHDLPHCKIRVRIGDCCVIRLYLDPSRVRVNFDWHRIVLHVGRDAHSAKNLPGKDPGFEFSVLLTEQSAAGSDN